MTRPDKTPPPQPCDRLVEGGRGIDVRPPVNLVPSQLPPIGPTAPMDATPVNQSGGGQSAPTPPSRESG